MRQELLDIVSPCLDSTSTWASTFLPHRFTRPWNELHDKIFDIVDDESVQFGVIAAPRGLGKTTTASIAVPSKKICFQDVEFIEMISCTHTVAAQNVRNLGRELVGNSAIRKVFGDLKGKIWSEQKGHIETSTGITVLARGAGQQVRGLLEGKGSRPDLIIIDDLEDSEPFRIGDPQEYLRKIKEWFFSDLMNSIDHAKTRIIYIGTILHQDSLLQNLLDDPMWKSTRLELCDDNYKSNFPEYMSDEKVRELAASYKEKGMLDVFYREYRNIAVAPEDAIFQQHFFKYWHFEKNPIHDPAVRRAVIVDPAKTVKIHSAYTALVGVGVHPTDNKIYQLDCVNAKMTPDRIYEEAYSMARRIHTTKIAVEVTSLNLFITQPFNMFLRKHGFPLITELHATSKKEERIAALAGFYRSGTIYHHPDSIVHGPLESQLIPFPAAKFVDVADAFAYLIKLFGLDEVYFHMTEEEDERALEEEIRQLDKLEAAERFKPLQFGCAP